MFDFIKHQGNLKENYNEISLHFTKAMNWIVFPTPNLLNEITWYDYLKLVIKIKWDHKGGALVW